MSTSHTTTTISDLHFDYIIVGAGTAGCLLANRLSANASKRILLIEAGGKDDYHWIHIPMGYLHCIGNPRTDWLYQTESEKGLNGRAIRYPRGKVLGGSSSINGMLYMRGQARDYDQWATLTGEASWRWENCLPYFKLHEDHHAGANAFHGAKGSDQALIAQDQSLYGQTLRKKKAGGEWRVDTPRVRWAILEAFKEAAIQAGIPATPDFNQGDNEGVGYFEVNQKNGWRWNTAKAFLRPDSFGRPNFELWTYAQVARLLVESKEGAQICRGIEVWNGREMIKAQAHQAVILCAGSIGTPQILQLSGIGPSALLQSKGITTQIDLRGVGANLQDHLQIRMTYGVRHATTLNTLSHSLWGKFKIGVEYALKQTGPMSMAPSQLCAFTRSDTQQAWPNLQYHVQPLSLPAFGEPLDKLPAFTASVTHLNPSSRGSVNISTPDFRQAPQIAPHYLSTQEDQAVALDAIKVTRRIVAQPALARFTPTELKPGPTQQTAEQLLNAIGDIGTTIFHPVGTARMGLIDDPWAVTTPQLQVRDGVGGTVRGLYIGDASIMPTITSGNTNSPVLMIAEKLAHHLIKEAEAALPKNV